MTYEINTYTETKVENKENVKTTHKELTKRINNYLVREDPNRYSGDEWEGAKEWLNDFICPWGFTENYFQVLNGDLLRARDLETSLSEELSPEELEQIGSQMNNLEVRSNFFEKCTNIYFLGMGLDAVKIWGAYQFITYLADKF